MTPMSSRGRSAASFRLLCSPSSPSIARRCRVFSASRSSRRSAHTRSICDETASALDRYSSISWTPEAKESSTGARLVVMSERRAETVEGEIGGRVWGKGVEPSCGSD